MFIFSNFLIAVSKIVDIALTFLYWLILIRALISWVNPDPFNPIVQFLYKTTDPILERIRRLLPFGLRMGIDISPVIAILVIIFLQWFLVRTIMDIALRVK
ncbi:MAG: YggT family protein [Candidatus Omnitrophica bacterium]|nr:YggT family protein [Candidatus Omnitrophota bacterium]